MSPQRERVAAVVVTHDRAGLLSRCLDGLAAQTRRPDLVVVVDNASDDDTPAVLSARDDLPLHVRRSDVNIGGAGGFHLGVLEALEADVDRVWLMDDDVVAAPDCLAALLDVDAPAVLSVREDRHGALVEKAAIEFDLRRPWAIRPKRSTVESVYGRRDTMPPVVEVQNVSFEGFLVHRRVIEGVGLPDPSMFIFYDDTDWALRMRAAGYQILAVRDAVMVRQLDFDQQHDMLSWKGFYMYRNLFLVHFRHGGNVAVRCKPFAITAALLLLSPWRGGAAEARNVTRALVSAVGMARRPVGRPEGTTGR
jgi:rhamnopyranosyl-N-acetylglucosaminyl-diphospho-decaprenol beta-1,3/1,4-galactofuranosyltransferase